MRIVFVGASHLTECTARVLVSRGHEVVVIDPSRERLDELVEGGVDCGLIHGDGSRPAVLRESSPEHADVLLCLTGDDQSNILASLVGRSLGFPRVVTRLEDADLEHIALELGLTRPVIPDRTIGTFLADSVEGRDVLELSSAIKGDARLFVFVAGEDDAGPLAELGLPERARVSHLYRGDKLVLADPGTEIEADDELVVVTDRDTVDALRARWAAGG